MLLSINLEEAAFLESAPIAIIDPFDGKLDIVGAHGNNTTPFAAFVVVEGINIVKPGAKFILDEERAGLAVDVPPTFARPAILVLVADRNADPARRAIAKLELRRGHAWKTSESRGEQTSRSHGAHKPFKLSELLQSHP